MLTFIIMIAIAIGIIIGALVPFWLYSKKTNKK